MKFQIYKAQDGFRWRAVAQNKKILADSGEAYATKGSAARALNRFVSHIVIKQRVGSVPVEFLE